MPALQSATESRPLNRALPPFPPHPIIPPQHPSIRMQHVIGAGAPLPQKTCDQRAPNKLSTIPVAHVEHKPCARQSVAMSSIIFAAMCIGAIVGGSQLAAGASPSSGTSSEGKYSCTYVACSTRARRCTALCSALCLLFAVVPTGGGLVTMKQRHTKKKYEYMNECH